MNININIFVCVCVCVCVRVCIFLRVCRRNNKLHKCVNLAVNVIVSTYG